MRAPIPDSPAVTAAAGRTVRPVACGRGRRARPPGHQRRPPGPGQRKPGKLSPLLRAIAAGENPSSRPCRSATSVARSAGRRIQLAPDPAYRSRVTALWSLALVGSTPIGSPVIGALAELSSPRGALVLGAADPVTAGVSGR